MPQLNVGMLQPKSEKQFMDEYRCYFDALATEDSRAALLVFFKERRDKNGDATCGRLLSELGNRFLTERWKDK